MLTFNVAALLKESSGATRNIKIDEPHPRFEEELHLVAPVHGQAHLMRTQEGIAVRADLHTITGLECSRCLEPVPVALDVHLEENFRPGFNVMTGAPMDAGEDDALWIDEHHELDLTEAARQYLVGLVPIGAWCRPDCQGLCPTCGVNRNVELCRCAEEPVSGSFAALAALLQAEDGASPR